MHPSIEKISAKLIHDFAMQIYELDEPGQKYFDNYYITLKQGDFYVRLVSEKGIKSVLIKTDD